MAVYRCYSEKRAGCDVEARSLYQNLTEQLERGIFKRGGF